MLPPVLGDVLLDCTPRRAIIIKARDTAVYFEGGHVKQAPLQYTCLHKYSKVVVLPWSEAAGSDGQMLALYERCSPLEL